MRRQTIVTTKTKISITLHFAKASSHKKISPRLETDTLSVGAYHRPKVMSCLEYGHAKEAKKIIMARACPPAGEKLIKYGLVKKKNVKFDSGNKIPTYRSIFL